MAQHKRTSELASVMTSASSWTFAKTYAGQPDQVGKVRRFLGQMLEGSPVADDAVLLCSELCANAVCHSNSRRPGGRFTVRAEIYEDDYLCLDVEDEGGPWIDRT